jgi:hypothetical protein
MQKLAGLIAGTCSIFVFLTCIPARAQQKTPPPRDFIAWLPISAAEQQMKAPKVESDAGAEVLLWRVHVVDELLGSNVDFQRVFYHYVRLKIFDDKGKEKAATIDLPYGDRGGILDVSGRTVKADGTVVELDKKSVYKRDLVRVGGRKIKAVSFAMPGVEPGAILEYRWKETVDDNRFFYVRLHFQREFPVEQVTYFVKPLPADYSNGYSMYLVPFNCRPSPLKPENDGYTSTTVESIPASHDELYAPNEANLGPWALLRYQRDARKDPDKYWNDVSRKAYEELKQAIKSSDDIKSAAAEAVKGAGNDDEKIAALIAVTRSRVRNVYDRDVTDTEREKYRKSLPKDRFRTSAEIFKSGLGSPDEMNVVFAALAQQDAIEARPALMANRNEIYFSPKSTVDDYFLESIDMAVKRGDSWKIYDVSTKFLPPGMISWTEEGVGALITDPKTAIFIQTPSALPQASAELRVAHLKLSAEGTLAGDVEESYSGHRAEDHRRELVRESDAQREQWVQDRLTHMFPGSEITAIKLTNLDDPAKPLEVRYHLEAPQYAQVTGKRILFQSSPFRRSLASPFTASTRRYPVEFPYAWKEADQIFIQLPAGWKLDSADSPGNVEFGKPGSYGVAIGVSPANELTVRRELVFGNEGMLIYPATTYPALKQIFDQMQVRDQHSLSIKAAN